MKVDSHVTFESISDGSDIKILEIVKMIEDGELESFNMERYVEPENLGS